MNMNICIVLLAILGIAAALHIEHPHHHLQIDVENPPPFDENEILPLELPNGQPAHMIFSGAQNKQGPGVPGQPCAICG